MTMQTPVQTGGSHPTEPAQNDPTQTGVVDAAKDEAAVVADRAMQETSRLVDEARRTLRSQSDQQTGRVASGARDVARQLDDLASGRGGTDGPVADFAHGAASRIDTLADRLETDGIDGITREVKQFARRRPGAYLFSAFALGIVAGRVFRNADTAALAHAARPEQDEHTGDAQTAQYPVGSPATDAPVASDYSTQEDTSWPTPPKH